MALHGLSSAEARARLQKNGPNEITRANKMNPFKILVAQFTSPFILVLLGAALVSWLVGFLPGQSVDITDSLLIIIIVVISGAAGFIQEYRSEQTVEALRRMATPHAKVLRDGSITEIKASEVVTGDVVLINAGDVIPADAELVEAYNLQINEAGLTGESLPVHRKAGEDIFMNTFVNAGTGKARVQKTGMETRMGSIAGTLESMKEDAGVFQEEMGTFSKTITLWIGVLILIMIAVGSFKYSVGLAILTAISLAVAAIPEGMPAVLTLTLSLNGKIMAAKNALVRKLSAIESIGAVDVICTDKTGTLTRGEMTVKKVFFSGKTVDMASLESHDLEAGARRLFTAAALCNNSLVKKEDGDETYLGDETEVALRRAAGELTITKEKLEHHFNKAGELSFTSERKMMSVLYRKEGRSLVHVFSKGAPEILIEHCSKILHNGKTVALNAAAKKKILAQNRLFAQNGLRVLGLAQRQLKETKGSDNTRDAEEEMVWLGLVAMYDPPRPEVAEAIRDSLDAGIRIIMITGDNALTAGAIAKEIGLKTDDIITGDKLDNLSEARLAKVLASNVNIFARTTPAHKLQILSALKKDYRVAMTGDGVNDSLALKKADVGVAMGVKGTEVAKEASDIILLDDNFATIRNAISEGRKTFDNIRKFVNYLLTSNVAEILVIFLATLFIDISGPVLLPVQILWINLLTDGMPALALGVDPARPNIMNEPPRGKHERILNRKLKWLIGAIGIKKTIILFATFFITLPMGLDVARTTLLTGFVFYEFVRIGAIRIQEKLTWFSNKWLLGALGLSAAVHLFILYSPLNTTFSVVPLSLESWGLIAGGVVIGYILATWIATLIDRYITE